MQENKYLPLSRGNRPLLEGSLGLTQFSSPAGVTSSSPSAQGGLKLPQSGTFYQGISEPQAVGSSAKGRIPRQLPNPAK